MWGDEKDGRWSLEQTERNKTERERTGLQEKWREAEEEITKEMNEARKKMEKQRGSAMGREKAGQCEPGGRQPLGEKSLWEGGMLPLGL